MLGAATNRNSNHALTGSGGEGDLAGGVKVGYFPVVGAGDGEGAGWIDAGPI